MSNFQLPKTPVGIAYVIALTALAATSFGLAATLFHVATRKPNVKLVSENDSPRVVVPGYVPDTLAHDFVSDFVVNWETYTPATLPGVLDFAKSRVSPSIHSQFEVLRANRRKIVSESRMVSQFLIEDRLTPDVHREAGRLEVIIRGICRIYIADKLNQEDRRVYRVALEAGEPSRGNPTGLLVRGLSVKRIENELGRKSREDAR